jgi:tRNA G18 (ribose-2'-O)-methylase SpoU
MSNKIKQNYTVSVLLENIRSSENVGSIFRTADAGGVSRIYLAGYTPTPVDRFGRPNTKITTRALGAEKTIPWESTKTATSIVRKLKKSGVTIIALEQSTEAVDYKKIKLTGDTLFILGNEVTGVEKKTLSLADTIAEIPMHGKKESLNVSVSFGIALFRIKNI